MFSRLLLLFLCASARIFVLNPEPLRQELAPNELEPGEIRASLANFGNPPYGSTLIGRLFYSPQESKACEPLSPLDFSDDPEARNSAILLVDRGSCLFVVKVRNAQDAGAQAVVVVDNVQEDVEALIMNDNGSGGNLNIPSFIISKADGEKLKKYLLDPEYKSHVVLQLLFDLTKSPTSVEMALWMSSSDSRVLGFLRDFNRFADQLTKEEFSFTPHYATIQCWACVTKNYTEEVPECIAGGRYCALDPDGFGPVTGRDVVMEDLRQICIFKEATKFETYAMWFDYMSAYNQTCKRDFSESCSKEVMKEVGIPIDIISSCVSGSVLGSNIALDENALLSEEQRLSYQYPLIFTPAIFLNAELYRGDIEAEEVALALCSSYTVPPPPCQHSQIIPPPGRTISMWTLLGLIALTTVLVGVVLVGYRMWIKKEMQTELKDQVSKAVAQYHALSSDGAQMAERPKVRTVIRKVENR